MSAKVSYNSAYDKLRSCVALGVLPARATLLLQVEYCTALRPSATLRGHSRRYYDYYMALKNQVQEELSEWSIRAEGVTQRPRIGAFEVSLSWECNGFPYRVTLFSKLHTRLWPKVELIVKSLASLLPRPSEEVCIRVVSASNGFKAVADTHLLIQDPDTLQVVHSAVTDAQGVASISTANDLYAVRAEAAGFETHTALLSLKTTEETVIRLTEA